MAGYTVIDFQTTGLHAAAHDRVIEIGVVWVDAHLNVLPRWSSLVNPGRDLGRSDIHGIRAADILDAPTFTDLAPAVLDEVEGRTVVCHNGNFELEFLRHELAQAGFPLEAWPVPSLTTMDLAEGVLGSRRLIDCCEEVGIGPIQRFSSQHQGLATAELMCHLLRRKSVTTAAAGRSAATTKYRWPAHPEAWSTPPCKPRTFNPPPRGDAWLDKLVSHMPGHQDSNTNSYLELLERALLDLHLSEHEKVGLVQLADRLGMDRTMVDVVHREYLQAMVRVALEDGIVTVNERADLDRVADMLGLASLDTGMYLSILTASNAPPAATYDPQRIRLHAGDSVCITGATTNSREDLSRISTACGVHVGGLNKSTALLVAADPDTLSGKALKARRYGVPIVTEEAFLIALTALGED